MRTYRAGDGLLWRQGAQRLQPLPLERVSICLGSGEVVHCANDEQLLQRVGYVFPNPLGQAVHMLIKSQVTAD